MVVHVWDTCVKRQEQRGEEEEEKEEEKEEKKEKRGDGVSTSKILLQDWCRAEGGGLKESRTDGLNVEREKVIQ